MYKNNQRSKVSPFDDDDVQIIGKNLLVIIKHIQLAENKLFHIQGGNIHRLLFLFMKLFFNQWDMQHNGYFVIDNNSHKTPDNPPEHKWSL